MALSSNSTLHSDIQHLSYRLLVLAREAVRQDSASAAMLFGLTSQQSELLAGAEMQRLEDLSRLGVVAFRPSFRLADLMAPPARASVVS